MSSLSGVGTSMCSTSYPAARAGQFGAKVFADLDTDSSGGIDKTELQSAFDKVAGATGTSARSADDLFSTIDSDGDGKISASELDAGMKSLMPPPSSTVDFASRREGRAERAFAKLDADGSGSLDADELQSMLDARKAGAASAASSTDSSTGSAALTGADLLKKLDTDGDGKVSEAEFAVGRPQHGGPPPGPPPTGVGAPLAAAAASSGSSTSSDSSSSASSTADAADTLGDGKVSVQERAAAELRALLASLASQFGNGTTDADSSVSALSMFA